MILFQRGLYKLYTINEDSRLSMLLSGVCWGSYCCLFLFRQANPSDLAKFRENANHEQLQYQKEQVLCLSCVVYPDMATYNQLVQDFAGVPYSLANEIWRQARGGDSVAKKV